MSKFGTYCSYRTRSGNPVRTPWGAADSASEYAPGIRFYGTPSHGGFKLDRAANAKVAKPWRRKGGWYEEDCEWNIVALTFPEVFDVPEMHKNAHRVLKDYFPDQYAQVTGYPVAVEESHTLQARAFREATRDKWVVVSAVNSSAHPGFVECIAYLGGRGDDYRFHGKEREFLVPSDEYKFTHATSFVIDLDKHEEITRRAA